MTKLKPCPFCGCEYVKDDDDYYWAGEHADWCPLDCNYPGNDGNVLVPNEKESIEAWNRRAKVVLSKVENTTIEAEPVRHGKWIGLEYDGYADGSPVYDLWECSECHMEHEGEEDTLTDYCPHCGAKMDLEEENRK